MADVEIYTGYLCGYCFTGKRLLRRKGAPYREISVSPRPGRRAKMVKRANGGYTVPQIFVDGGHIGGYDDLMVLNAEGKFDPLLNLGG